MILIISPLAITILKVVAVVVILLAMVVIILGIGHIFSGQFESDAAETRRLRDEVKSEEEVIGHGSVFHSLVNVPTPKKKGR